MLRSFAIGAVSFAFTAVLILASATGPGVHLIAA